MEGQIISLVHPHAHLWLEKQSKSTTKAYTLFFYVELFFFCFRGDVSKETMHMTV